MCPHDGCLLTFLRKCQLKIHIDHAHRVPKPEPPKPEPPKPDPPLSSTPKPFFFKCMYPGCHSFCESEDDLQLHNQNIHGKDPLVNPPTYRCAHANCFKVFETKGNLAYHTSRVHALKLHKCAVCGKSFKEKFTLTRHMKKHANLTERVPLIKVR